MKMYDYKVCILVNYYCSVLHLHILHVRTSYLSDIMFPTCHISVPPHFRSVSHSQLFFIKRNQSQLIWRLANPKCVLSSICSSKRRIVAIPLFVFHQFMSMYAVWRIMNIRGSLLSVWLLVYCMVPHIPRFILRSDFCGDWGVWVKQLPYRQLTRSRFPWTSVFPTRSTDLLCC